MCVCVCVCVCILYIKTTESPWRYVLASECHKIECKGHTTSNKVKQHIRFKTTTAKISAFRSSIIQFPKISHGPALEQTWNGVTINSHYMKDLVRTSQTTQPSSVIHKNR